MAEIVGIVSAAVSFALKLEHMIQSISNDLKDAREFGSTLEKARLQMQWEADRMKDMRVLLFGQSDQSTIISGVTFANFDKRTQLAILNILRRFSELLALNYKIIDGRYAASEPSVNMILNPSMAFDSFQHGTLAKKLRWGFRDKKKLDKVLQELESWNDRLFARIQISFLRLTPQETMPLSNLSRPSLLIKSQQLLNDNVEAGKLGLADDAKLLHLASAPSSAHLSGLKITDFEGWTFSQASQSRGDISRSTAHVNGQPVLLEYKAFLPDLQGNPTPAVEARVEQLASILHSQKSDRYHTLACRGYYLEESRQRLVFAFDVPLDDRQSTLTTLHQDLLTQKSPALEDRFILARTLALSLSQLFAVGWVHKSFRSDNVLHFRKPTEPTADSNWPKPYILGLEYARPTTEASSRPIDRDEIGENIYRHPEQWGLPTISFSILHDVYALGVVLLEIGIWRQAITLSRSRFSGAQTASSVQQLLVLNASRAALRASMGRRYQEVVLRCLRGDFGDPGEGTVGEKEVDFLERFNSEVVDVLDDIAQSL